ncbi:MAG: hypothetical protein N2971_08355 [Chlorobi bacterium]|nr:hypothetical protein [Chlorobiota bacterium]
MKTFLLFVTLWSVALFCVSPLHADIEKWQIICDTQYPEQCFTPGPCRDDINVSYPGRLIIVRQSPCNVIPRAANKNRQHRRFFFSPTQQIQRLGLDGTT